MELFTKAWTEWSFLDHLALTGIVLGVGVVVAFLWGTIKVMIEVVKDKRKRR